MSQSFWKRSMAWFVACKNALLTHKYRRCQSLHQSYHSRVHRFAYLLGCYQLRYKFYWPHQIEMPFQFQNSETKKKCWLKAAADFKQGHGSIKLYDILYVKNKRAKIVTIILGCSMSLQFKPHCHILLYHGLA